MYLLESIIRKNLYEFSPFASFASFSIREKLFRKIVNEFEIAIIKIFEVNYSLLFAIINN